MLDIETTPLWQHAFDAQGDKYDSQRQRLRVAMLKFRDQATLLAEAITASVPDLTDHSVRHLDSLWQLASTIAGPKIRLNALEAFTLGGAILLHDLANSAAAFIGNEQALYDDSWHDLIHAGYLSLEGRRPTPEELKAPSGPVRRQALLERLRHTHAQQAERLAVYGFSTAKGESTYLIDDQELRASMGAAIGRIAHSHHWPISRVVSEFRSPIGTPGWLPREWTVRQVLIACLLRCADAAHLDRGRAPAIVRATRNLLPGSRPHWQFQSKLTAPVPYQSQLAFTSTSPFQPEERDAWWLCIDTLRMVDRELRTSARAVREVYTDTVLPLTGVHGIESVTSISKQIRTTGWEPVEVRFHVSDVTGVVKRLGGSNLYNDRQPAALRELLSNAVDAVRARRRLEDRSGNWGQITITLERVDTDWQLTIQDTGIGMSEDVLTGPLLDFGTTYWRSPLARREHPGLLSSDFRPIGRFGIGFFSVFMLGDHVTVHSRPTQHGVDSERVLELSADPSVRPFLRRPSRTDGRPLHDGGTRIRITLNPAAMSESGLAEANEEAGMQLSRLVRRLAPAVPVDIFMEGPGLDNTVVVQANDWQSLPVLDLFERVGGAESSKAAKRVGLFGDVRSDGKLLGRIGLVGRWSYGASGTVTVGGFASDPTRRYVGLLIGGQPSLDRFHARPTLQVRDLRRFLEDGLSKPQQQHDWRTVRHLAQLCLSTGITPNELKVMTVVDDAGEVDVCDIASYREQAKAQDEVWLVLDTSFEVQGVVDYETVDIEIQDAAPQISFSTLPMLTLVCTGANDDTWSTNLDGCLYESFPPRRGPRLARSDGLTPNSVLAMAVAAVVEAWRCDFDELVDQAHRGRHTIGTMETRVGEADVDVRVLVLYRPDV